jgi:hypothetical protein
MSFLESKLAYDLDKYQAWAEAYPLRYGIFIALSIPLAILTSYFLHRRRNASAFWSIVGFILVELAFRDGDDIKDHAFRVIGMLDELRRGNLNELLINPQTGQGFPIFVYYSFVPYIIPLALDFTGFSAFVATKFALGLYFLFFCSGLHFLVRKNCLRQARLQDLNFEYLLLLFFMCATYVYGIWVKRDALGEVALYAFIPWAVISLLAERPARPLMIIFFLQLSMHPVIFAQSIVCEIALAYGISEMPLLALGRRLLLPFAFALILAIPFWLPPILWLNLIAGNSVLPVPFSTTFLSFSKLFSLYYNFTVGPWLILSVILMSVAFRKQLGGRAWILVAGFLLMLAIQTIYLRPLTLRVPAISIFQFVWRLMMSAAFIGLAALLAGLKGEKMRATLPLTILTVFAFLNMFVISLISTPKSMKTDAFNESSYAANMRIENMWAVALFGPNYSRFPQDCSHAKGKDLEAISFSGLRGGVVPSLPFIAVENAPVGLVKYKAGYTILPPSVCGQNLILGPVPAGKIVTVDDAKLRDLCYVRIFFLLLGIAFLILTAASKLLVIRPNRRAQRIATPGQK